MKKIGIMSMQRVINYGSFMQAYALKKTIESLGHKVEFVDYEYEKTIVEENKKSIIEKIKKNCNLIWFLKKKSKLSEFRNFYQRECLKYLNVSEEKNYYPQIDTLVIGSDEVFNCMQGYPVGYSRNLFGYKYDMKKISYAGSFGYTTIDMLKDKKIDKEVGELLSEFEAISVRDSNSKEIVEHLTDFNVETNLDPVLIYDFEKEIKDIKIDMKNYIIVYAYTGRLNKEEQKTIKKFAKKHNKKIVSLGFPQEVADVNIVVDPFEMLAYFKNADFVITDTFHGTIFSVVTNTKFISLVRKSNFNKMKSLLENLTLEERLITNLDNLDEKYKQEIDFNNANNIRKEAQNQTIEYLKKYL